MTTTDKYRNDINADLARQGLRIARDDERGWYALAMTPVGVVKVWATDEPEVAHVAG